MIETVINRDLEGRIVEMFKRCSTCGVVFWDGKCPNVEIFGECSPSPEPPRMRNKGKYRKTPSTQVTLRGNNLRDLFWGIKEVAVDV